MAWLLQFLVKDAKAALQAALNSWTGVGWFRFHGSNLLLHSLGLDF